MKTQRNPFSVFVLGNGGLDKLAGGAVTARTLVFRGCHNRFLPMERPDVSRVRRVWFDRCDRHFVDYCLHPSLFPSAEEFYMDSHPHSAKVMARFCGLDRDGVGGSVDDCRTLPTLFVHERWRSLLRRMPETRSIQFIDAAHYAGWLALMSEVDRDAL
jgi:hypothetical protein